MLDPRGKEIRREEDLVRSSGTAVLALGVWTAMKYCATLLLRRSEIPELIEQLDIPRVQFYTILFLSLLLIVVISMAVHVYIGIAARAAAFDRKIKPPFLFLSWLLFFATSLSFLLRVISLLMGDPEPEDGASIIIDLTLIIALWRLNRSASRLKKMRRQMAGG